MTFCPSRAITHKTQSKDVPRSNAVQYGVSEPNDVPPRHGKLPCDVTSFVGRRRLRATLKRMVTSTRLITLTGTGGVGKTRLAVRVAADAHVAFPGGVWFVELAPVESPSLLADTVAEEIGLRGPHPHGSLGALREFLVAPKSLLVLDNCEHLVDGVSDLVTQLLRDCPELHTLTTSRQALGCKGEHVLSVPPMSVPDEGSLTITTSAHVESVQLFLDRACAVLPEFELSSENIGDVVDICRAVEGIPLAVELAAVRLRGLSTSQIAQRLGDQFRLLTTGPRGVPDRQRTLQNCIDWSFDLCTPDEQDMWAQLSVFSGGFELDAAGALHPGRAEDELLDLVLSLVEKSILIRTESAGQIRYRMLEMIREYGERSLDHSGQRDVALRRHRDHFAFLAARARSEWLGTQQVGWLHTLHVEHANFRRALQFCLDSGDGLDTGMATAADLLHLWTSFGLVSEGRAWIDRYLAAATGPTPARLRALHVGVWLDAISGHLDRGQRLLNEAAEVATTLGGAEMDLVMQARGVHALYSGNTCEAVSYFRNAASGFRAAADDYRVLQTLCPMGVACELAGEIDLGLDCHRECMEISERYGEIFYRSFALSNAGMLDLHRGDPEQAAQHLQDSLRLKISLDDRFGIAMVLESLAIATTEIDPHRAAVLLGVARAGYTSIGLPSDALLGRSRQLYESEQLLSRKLSDSDLHQAIAEGSRLERAVAIAFALGDEPITTRASRHSANTDVLTRRENQVAALLAEGLTNKEIALRLVISRRTAESHVDHILTKLGLNSRAQVASWFASRNKYEP